MKHQVKDFFGFVLDEKDVSNLKPHPEVYLKSAEHLGINPNSVLVHEDSPTGVKAARSANCYVAVFPVHDNLEFEGVSKKEIFSSWKNLCPSKVLERVLNSS